MVEESRVIIYRDGTSEIGYTVGNTIMVTERGKVFRSEKTVKDIAALI